MVRTVKKPEVRRLEIVRAARDLFLRGDYETTTMQDVVDALGVAKGLVYYYFPSKTDLLEAVVELVIAETTQGMRILVETAPGNALEKLRALIAAGRIAGENADLLEHMHNPANAALHTRLLAAALRAQAPLFAALVEQGAREGLFHVDDPLSASEFILAATQFLTDEGIHAWTPEELTRRMRAFPALIERVLQAPPGSFRFLAG